MLVDPSGSFLYVAGSDTDTIYSFDINSTTGALSTLETVPTGNTDDTLLSLAIASPVLPPWGYGVGPQLESVSLSEEVATIIGEACEMAAQASFGGFNLDIRRFMKDWTSSDASVATATTFGLFTGVMSGNYNAEASEPVTGIRPQLTTQARTNINFRISQNTSGLEPDDASDFPELSSDGRYVVYQSDATDLIASDGNLSTDIFCFDRKTGTTERISNTPMGDCPDDDSGSAHISGDGRFIVFESEASDLVANDINGFQDIFLYDRTTGTIERINLDINGLDANERSSDPRISADGRYIVYESDANDLVTGDINGVEDCFLYDRINGPRSGSA